MMLLSLYELFSREKSKLNSLHTINNVSPVGVVVVVVGAHLPVRNQSHTSLKACLHVLCQALKTDRVQSNLWMLQYMFTVNTVAGSTGDPKRLYKLLTNE